MAVSQEYYNQNEKNSFLEKLKDLSNIEFKNDAWSVSILKDFIMTNHQKDLKLKDPLPSILELENYLMSIYKKPSSLEYPIEIRKILNKVKKEVEKISLLDTTIKDIAVFEQAPEAEMIATLILHNVSFSILSSLKKDKVLDLRTQIHLALKKLENSPFKKVLSNASVSIGTVPALKAQGFVIRSTKNLVASYYRFLDTIIYPVNAKGESIRGEQPAYQNLIHEFGHRYHNTLMVDGYDNKSILDLYKKAIQPQEQCYLDHLPKLGDSLSDLREDWWNVRMGSKDYILVKIENDYYTYLSDDGDVIIAEKKNILKRITCPSRYGASDEKEFFAEMVTLITLGLVKPNQQVVANKFLQIVKQESL
jgi:hypothetical protein